MIISLFLALITQTPIPAEPDPRPLQQRYDAPRMSACMGGLVGFRNVHAQCVVSESGLGQCELMTDNRDVLRYRDRFLCMASHITVTYPDGSPAVGRKVQTTLNGSSHLSQR